MLLPYSSKPPVRYIAASFVALGALLLGCNPEEHQPATAPDATLLPESEIESQHFALSACSTDADCFPAPSCRNAVCIAGECRYPKSDLDCCTADIDCSSVNQCLVGKCQVTPGNSQGLCSFGPDPLKPGCCTNADECPDPPGTFVAACLPKPGTNYNVCTQSTDPESCAPPSQALVINEFMVNPDAASELTGEWIELFNPGLQDVDLRNWVLRDEAADWVKITGATPIIIPAGGYFLLARSDNPQNNGFLFPDYVYNSMVLGNGLDDIILINPQGEEVDRVSYEAPDFPIADGASLQLINPYMDNSLSSSWQAAQKTTPPYLDKGTPGEPNIDAFYLYYTPIVCDDKNSCTLDICGDGYNSRCTHTPLRDCCLYNQDCEDGNPCTINTCNESTLTCQTSSIPGCCVDSSWCNDGNLCTDDSCINNRCRHITSPFKPDCCVSDADCKDINPCTVDYCALDPGGAFKTCHHTFPGGAKCCLLNSDCNDNKVETLDKCVNYYCNYSPNPKFCLGPPPQYCNDNDPCTQDICNLDLLLCQHQPIPGCCKVNADCNDGDPCTDDFCQVAVRTCTHTTRIGCCHSNADCQEFITDKDLCREPVCLDNTCRLVHIPSEECCLTKLDCDDGNSCTNDTCDPGTNLCIHTNVGQGCCNSASDCPDDDNPCSAPDCVANKCTFRTLPGCCKANFECDDGNVCTYDLCENYKCRFKAMPGAGCCNSDSDCPAPESSCLRSICSPQKACTLEPLQPCVVTPNWLERFPAGQTLEQLGWSSTESPIGAFVSAFGEDTPLGPDGSALLIPNAAVSGSTVCLLSPYVSAQNTVDPISATWEHFFQSNLALTYGTLKLTVEAQSLNVPQTITLVHLEQESYTSLDPVMVQIPQKMLSAPFRLRFCAAIPQGATDVLWAIDSVKIGKGTPPRFLDSLVDLALTPGQSDLQSLNVEDLDGDHLQFHLQGPNHVSLKGITSKGPGKASATLLFSPQHSSDLGKHTVSLEVSDGFFVDRRSMTEIAYIPKCIFDSDCNDNNDCTVESCNPIEGCSYTTIPACCNLATPCNDNNYCTTDICIDGTCSYEEIDCFDNNICTEDLCDPLVGCKHPFASVECDDANACTWHDFCFQGQCKGVQLDCNDGLSCTLDSCNVLTGCQNKSLCSDSIFCTMDVCTSQGCRSGKVPVGTPNLDGVESNDWLPSSAYNIQSSLFSRFRWMQDTQALHLLLRAQVKAGEGIALFIDRDFTKNSGVVDLSTVQAGQTNLASLLAPTLEVNFPGFGAEFAVVARWDNGAPPALPSSMACFAISAADVPQSRPCTISAGPDATVEITIPWSSIHGPLGPVGNAIAAVALIATSSGSVVDSLPPSSAGTISDVRLAGIVDASCLLPVCGDGVADTGEQCDQGALNSNFHSDRCRSNCTNFRCGDGVKDSNEECDLGIYNSDSIPDSCRLNCRNPHCGDGILDASEQCDLGPLNSDTAPDSCRTTCLDAFCGDGTTDSLEGCDEGPLNSDTTPDRCRTNCSPPLCGDGVVDTGEQCDNAAFNSDTEPNRCRLDCSNPHCGDGVVDFGEQCDLGLGNSDTKVDWCRTSCKNAYCGDGVQDAGEQCDDGNNVDWDGCQANCTIYITQCGDGIKTPDEECDNGANNSDVTPNACRRNCKNPHCGDGVVDNGETCDDGNLLGGDTCGPDCKPYVPGCGNGWIDPGEECDNGPLNSDTSPDACRLDCKAPKCGDDVIDTNEQCDNGPANSDTAPNACRTNCLNARCGDGTIDSGEQCDKGPLNANLPDRCKTNCVSPICGDGVVDVGLGEGCDNGPLNNDTLPGACRTNCLPARCGDNVIDTGEICDDGLDNSDSLPDRCRLDCTPARCGDGTTDSTEQCDQGTTNSNSAPDTCRLNCLLPRCGDNVVDTLKGELCDAGSANSDTTPNACRSNCLPARCGDTVVDSGEACDDGNTASHDGCTPDCQIEVYIPSAGDIIITEIMQNPKAVANNAQEWFELYNTRDYQIDINGWEIYDEGYDFHQIANGGYLWVPPKGYLVLGLTGNYGAHNVSYHYPPGLLLGNASDGLVLAFQGIIVDQVFWDDGATFPDPGGASMSLDPSRYSHTLNDQGINWCTATTQMADGDLGTPGLPNPPCP